MVTYSNIFLTEAETPVEPVTLAQVKAWLKVDYADDDALLTDMIVGARQSIESYLNLALVEKTVEVDINATNVSQFMPMPYAVKIQEDSFVITDSDNDDELLTVTEYDIRKDKFRVDYAGNYSISYTVVPVLNEAIREAIKMEVAERYHNRGELKEGLSAAAKAKAQPYKRYYI